MRIRAAAIVALLLCIVAPLHAAIRGVVMTFEGKPIAGARAVAYPAETWPDFRARFVSDKPARVPVAETTSDAKGAFSVDAGKSGSFDVVLEAPGFAPLELRALADFDLGATPLREAPLKTGRVTAGGKPVAGARSSLNRESRCAAVSWEPTVRVELPEQRCTSMVGRWRRAPKTEPSRFLMPRSRGGRSRRRSMDGSESAHAAPRVMSC